MAATQLTGDSINDDGGGARTWYWESEEFTKDIVEQLQRGEVLETRALLKPIFRCMKYGVHKNGARDAEMIEMAFAFAEWMVQLATLGDAERGLAPMPNLQPSYALNTIVTASQRAGSVVESQRAFDSLLAHGYEPDVFTYTALIDVISRSGDLHGATKVFNEMRASKSRPNIVTFTTLIRAVSYTNAVDASECLTFLRDARADDTFDAALFWEALDVCASRKSVSAATAVLREIQCSNGSDCGGDTRDSTRIVRALTQVLHEHAEREAEVARWLAENLVTADEHAAIASAEVPTAPRGARVTGCLGQQTTDSVRLAVMQHDIMRLAERLRNGVAVTTNDFETLIHQCRKRKWKEGVSMVLDAMQQMVERGWELPAAPGNTDDAASAAPPFVLPPQPHLQPTSKMYVSVVDAYMVCGEEQMAWDAFLDVAHHAVLKREPALYRKFIRGAYLLTQCDHIAELLVFARQDNVALSHRACVELARMHGYLHADGLATITERLPAACTGDDRKTQTLFEELVLSCAYKFNALGVEETLQGMLARGYTRSAQTECAVFICCLQHGELSDAQRMLRGFQRARLVLATPMYDSLLREMYFKYTRRGGHFDEASRRLAHKTLYSRRALFTQAFAEIDALERLTTASDAPDAIGFEELTVASPQLHEAALTYWCDRSELECAALMFAQHVVEVIATIRDKESKAAAQAAIYRALQHTCDPFLFTLRAVVSLRFLDLTLRALAKLAKQMLEVFRDNGVAVCVKPHHAAFCVTHLSDMSVHVVKEIDDVVALHASHRADVLAFCNDALEHDNMDKTIGFVVHTAELYTLATATYLVPKLAELYVLQGQVTVLQFFKPDVPDSDAMRRLFLREVIEIETIVDEESRDDSGDGGGSTGPRFACTTKAITEFKLQHEDEFMPFLLHRPPRMPRTDEELAASEDPTREYLALPLDADCVVVVDSDDTVALAYEVLMHASVDAVGVDAEWRPDAGRGYVQSKCSVLQIACATHVFLFDLLELALADVEELFAHLFASRSVVKIGFALDGDIKRLRWSFPDARCFDTFANVLDFSLDDEAQMPPQTLPPLDGVTRLDASQTSSTTTTGALNALTDDSFEIAKLKHRRRRQRGLASYVHEVLGLPLSKVQQRSDWERRPLTPQQIAYGALDAYCLIMLRDALQQREQAATLA